MMTTSTAPKPRKLCVRSKDFHHEAEALTKENSVSTGADSPSPSQKRPLVLSFPPAAHGLALDMESVLADVTAERLAESDFLANLEPGRRKRANSNCAKAALPANDYQKKYKTEICKNFQFKGFCQWGDLVG